MPPQRLCHHHDSCYPKDYVIPPQRLRHATPKTTSYHPKDYVIPAQRLRHTTPKTTSCHPKDYVIPPQRLRHTTPKTTSYQPKDYVIPPQRLHHATPKTTSCHPSSAYRRVDRAYSIDSSHNLNTFYEHNLYTSLYSIMFLTFIETV